MTPNNISEYHIEQTLANIDKERIRKAGHFSSYGLMYNGKSYPARLVLSLGDRLANGEELNLNKFEVGEGTSTFN